MKLIKEHCEVIDEITKHLSKEAELLFDENLDKKEIAAFVYDSEVFTDGTVVSLYGGKVVLSCEFDTLDGKEMHSLRISVGGEDEDSHDFLANDEVLSKDTLCATEVYKTLRFRCFSARFHTMMKIVEAFDVTQ
jgi:hypothetical protein